MDEIVKVEPCVDRAIESKQSGPFAEITTQRGNVYRVWSGYDSLPSIELVTRVAQNVAQQERSGTDDAGLPSDSYTPFSLSNVKLDEV